MAVAVLFTENYFTLFQHHMVLVTAIISSKFVYCKVLICGRNKVHENLPRRNLINIANSKIDKVFRRTDSLCLGRKSNSLDYNQTNRTAAQRPPNDWMGDSPPNPKNRTTQSFSTLLQAFLFLLSRKQVLLYRLVQRDMVGQNIHCSYAAHPLCIACT